MGILLENKTAVIYGAGGAIGDVGDRAFAREGAKVFLAGRTLAPLDAVAGEIFAAGGGGCDTPCGCGEREDYLSRACAARSADGHGRDCDGLTAFDVKKLRALRLKHIIPITKARGELNEIQTRGKQSEPSDSGVAS